MLSKKLLVLSSALALSFALSAPQSVLAETFNGEAGTMDFNDPMNWENDSHPGVSGGQARIGEVGTGADMVAFQNPATVTLSANSLGAVNGLRVGQSGGGDGTFNHSAGTLPTTDWSFIGVDGTDTDPSIGRYNLSGTAAFGSSGNTNLHLGLGGGAHPNNPNQGFVSIADQASILANAIVVGANDGNEGTLTQTGGTVTSDNWVTVGEAGGASGTYNMSAGSLTGLDLTIGQADADTTGLFDFSGTSTLTFNNLFVGRAEFGAGGAVGDLNVTGSSGSITINDNAYFGGNGQTGGFPGDANGGLNFIADAGGVTEIDVINGSVFLNDGTSVGTSDLTVDLTAMDCFSLFNTGTTPKEIVLIDNSTNLSAGMFAGLAEGAAVSVGGGQTGILSYVGGADGLDVTLTVMVPEPSSLVMVLLAGLGVLAIRRR